MYPISETWSFNNWREFQNRGTECIHAPIYVVDAPKSDETEDSEVVEFKDKHIPCALHDEIKYHEAINLVKNVQTYHHITTCRKKNAVACRFSACWVPSGKTRIVHPNDKIDETKVKHSKNFIDKLHSYIVTISDLSGVTQSYIWEECGVTLKQ